MLRGLCAICSSIYIFRVMHWLHGESTSVENFNNTLFDSLWGFPGGTSDKELSCQCRRHKRRGSNPSMGKISWRRKWQPTPVFLPGVSMDRGAWWATVYGVSKSQTWLKWLRSHVILSREKRSRFQSKFSCVSILFSDTFESFVFINLSHG